MFELFGFRVLEAANGRLGAELFARRAQEVTIVLLDMTMPEMGGEETFRELRRVREDVAVILTSGYNEIEATRRFVAKGLAGFLQKPFTPDELAVEARRGGHPPATAARVSDSGAGAPCRARRSQLTTR